MADAIRVRAQWDPDAKVWWAESINLPGLITEAATPELLSERIQGIALDLSSDDPALASRFDRIDIEYERQDHLTFA